MSIACLLQQIRNQPASVEFDQVMDMISTHYDYSPGTFSNGDSKNVAGNNEGSCRIFAFALLHGLDKQQTLACFGKYYREDVLNNPDGSDHANIRNFMKYGWEGIQFEQAVLVARHG
jgi:hypothetical protein